jgi:multidrug efflux pump
MFAKFFIDRPIFAWVIALIILLAGGLALRQLPVASYPAVAPPALSITLNYPGASAQVVEESVVALIEQEMNGIERLLYMESASEQGIGTVTLTFEAGTNLDLASVEAQNRIKRAEARLPEEVRRLGITVNKAARNYLLFISLFSPDNSQSNVDLGSYAAANVLESIRRTPGVGEAILFGTEYSMRLWLKPERLHAYGLTPADVAKAVRAQNTQLATGELGQLPAAEGQQLNAVIVTRSRLATPEEFGEIIVKSNAGGATVRVKDMSPASSSAPRTTASPRAPTSSPRRPSPCAWRPGANALDTAKAVKDRMAELRNISPRAFPGSSPTTPRASSTSRSAKC